MSQTPIPAPPPLNLNNVQGDILAGLPKKTQTYFFFVINQFRVEKFRQQLAKLIPLITTTAQVLEDQALIDQNKKTSKSRGQPPPLLRMSGVNIVFSQKGLTQLGITQPIGDSAYQAGMLAGAQDLGDPGVTSSSGTFTPDWVPAFKQDIHGMIIVSGDCHETVALKLEEIEEIFFLNTSEATIHEVIRIVGDVRPGAEKGHEHFGFLDGISQPAVQDVNTTPNPGQETIPQGTTLLGRTGDVIDSTTKVTTRPAYALDGSLLAFRYLFQLVPEFENFLTQNPIKGSPAADGSALLGARLVGRWKSGAPIDVTPFQDNPTLGADPLQNNNFRYDFANDPTSPERCPFAAHTRKTNPRFDLEGPFGDNAVTPHRIIRRGIQFGPEVTAKEAKSNQTFFGRGLLFAAYQSNIVNGFQFIQQSWADNFSFPPKPPPPTTLPADTPGIDPIIGQLSPIEKNPGSRSLQGTDPNNATGELALPINWVVPKGGEYFFSPSIPVLKSVFAL